MFPRAVIRTLLGRSLRGWNYGRCSPSSCHPLADPWPVLQKVPQRQYAVCIGDETSLTKTFTAEDVKYYAENLSLDTNPMHLDAEFAKTTRYKKPIVHGLLVVSLISGVIGAHLAPPGSVLMRMDISFTAPTYVGETVTGQARLAQLNKRKGVYDFKCFVKEEDGSERVVIKGSTDVLIPKDKL